MKNASLTMPPGTRGVVIDAHKFSRRVNLTDAERTKALGVIRDAEKEILRALRAFTRTLLDDVQTTLGVVIDDDLTGKPFELDDTSTYDELKRVKILCLSAAEECEKVGATRPSSRSTSSRARSTTRRRRRTRSSTASAAGTSCPRRARDGQGLRRHQANLSVGDKMAGRHGNKGVISKICPQEDMPTSRTALRSTSS